MANALNGDDGLDKLISGGGGGGGGIASGGTTEEDIEKQKKMLENREELAKIQEDIATLRLVLNDKLKREHELKIALGITFVDEIKQDLNEGLNQIKSTSAFQKAAQTITDLGSTVSSNDYYQKTSAGLKTATQKITPAFQTIGGTMKSGLGNLKNSNVFKSFEAGIGSTLSGVKGKMKGTKSAYNIDDSVNTNGIGGIPTSHTSQNISSNGNNGVTKHETIPEDKD